MGTHSRSLNGARIPVGVHLSVNNDVVAWLTENVGKHGTDWQWNYVWSKQQIEIAAVRSVLVDYDVCELVLEFSKEKSKWATVFSLKWQTSK